MTSIHHLIILAALTTTCRSNSDVGLRSAHGELRGKVHEIVPDMIGRRPNWQECRCQNSRIGLGFTQ